MNIVRLPTKLKQELSEAVNELKFNQDVIIPCHGFEIIIYKNKPTLHRPQGGPIGCYINDTSGG